MRRSVTVTIPLGRLLLVALIVLASVGTMAWAEAKKAKPDATGTLVPSTGAAACLPNAAGTLKIFKQGDTEKMTLSVSGLPKNSEFDVFVIQQPDSQFGMSWYQGDISTDKTGKGTQSYVGRFSIETFIVSPGSVAVVRPHTGGAFPDATSNPSTAPVHTFHVGVWFNSPADAEAAGCPATETPFNGDHTAGIQVLKTENVNGAGPLEQIQ